MRQITAEIDHCCALLPGHKIWRGCSLHADTQAIRDILEKTEAKG